MIAKLVIQRLIAKQSGDGDVASAESLPCSFSIHGLLDLRQSPADDFRVFVVVCGAVGVRGNERAIVEPHGGAEATAARNANKRFGIDHDLVMLEIEFESVFRFSAENGSNSQGRLDCALRKGQHQSALTHTQH